MMIRDMDIAAELMGVKPLAAKLSAFAVSSFYCGVAGALMVFFWLGAAEVESFDILHSFLVPLYGHHRWYGIADWFLHGCRVYLDFAHHHQIPAGHGWC